MKIVHICLASFFPDGYSYQENMLPKFHKQMGHDVEVIASLVTFDENGKSTLYPAAREYQNEYDIHVTRLNYKSPSKIYRTLRRYVGFREALEKANPDVLFVHGCQFLDIDIIKNYMKLHPDVSLFVDNHADLTNSATNWLSRNVLHKVIWRHCACSIEPYTKKFYGVLPVRVEFLKQMYKLPEDKCELLVMGADDDRVKMAAIPDNMKAIRQKYNISEDDFLIMSGGKIDQWKTQTLLLMQAVQNIKDDRVKLIVFGSVTPELKNKVNALSDGKKVQYIGWVESAESYLYFAASDLVVFPGRHSVFWEQVTGQGKPMLVKDLPGTHHVDLGGNVVFLQQDTVDEIQSKIEGLLNNHEKYEKMKDVAEEKGMMTFSYRDIAMRSIK